MLQKIRQLQKDRFWAMLSIGLTVISFSMIMYLAMIVTPWFFFGMLIPCFFFGIFGISCHRMALDEDAIDKEEEKLKKEFLDFQESLVDAEEEMRKTLKFWGGEIGKL